MTLTHKIKKLDFAIQFDSEATAFDRQTAVTSFARERMVKVMEQVFDHYTRPGYIQRFDGITIDLGQIRMDEFPHELEYRLRKKLHDFFKDHGEGPVSCAGSTPVDIHSLKREDEDNIIFFLINGFLPWQATFSDGADMGKILENLLQTRPDRVMGFLKHAGDKKRISKRLARQFPVPLLEKLVRLLSPGEGLPYAEYTKKDKEPALIPGGQSLASDVKTSVIIGSQGEKSRFWEKRIFDNLSGKQISMHPDTGPNLDTSFDSSIAPDRSRVKDSMPERSGRPGPQKAGKAEPKELLSGQRHEKKRLPHTLKEMQAILKKGGHQVRAGDEKRFMATVQALADDPDLFEILVSGMRYHDLLQWVETLVLCHEMIFKKGSFLSGKKLLQAKIVKQVRKTSSVDHTPGIFLAQVLTHLIRHPSKAPEGIDGLRSKGKDTGLKIEWGPAGRTSDPAAAVSKGPALTGDPGKDPAIADRWVDKADHYSKDQAGEAYGLYPAAAPDGIVRGSRETDLSAQPKHDSGMPGKKRRMDRPIVKGLFGVIRKVIGSGFRAADLMRRLLKKHDLVWEEMTAIAGEDELRETLSAFARHLGSDPPADASLSSLGRAKHSSIDTMERYFSSTQKRKSILRQMAVRCVRHSFERVEDFSFWLPDGWNIAKEKSAPPITAKGFKSQDANSDVLNNLQTRSPRKTGKQAGMNGIAQMLGNWLQDPALVRETATLPVAHLRQFLMILCRVHSLNTFNSASMSGYERDPVRFIGRVYQAVSLPKAGDQKDFLVRVMVCLAENRIAELDTLFEQGRQDRMSIPTDSHEFMNEQKPASAGSPGSPFKRPGRKSFRASGHLAEVNPLLRPPGKLHRLYRNGDPIFIDNAGMVLAWPFLPTLFKKLDLVETSVFKAGEAVHKAIHTLEYMVNSRLMSPEYHLVLNKILCGVGLQVPVKRKVKLEKSESDIVGSLLLSMITHWKALGKISVKGFQESFLIREGKLSFEKDVWTLVVAPKPFDMLLDRIPWTYSHVRLPWMERVVHVQWR